jgi:hypothetical protein
MHDDIELQQLLAGLKEVDEAFATEAMAAYPSFLASVPTSKLKVLAVRGAMHALELAYQLDRHNPAVDSLLRFIVMDVIPTAKLSAKIRLAK